MLEIRDLNKRYGARQVLRRRQLRRRPGPHDRVRRRQRRRQDHHDAHHPRRARRRLAARLARRRDARRRRPPPVRLHAGGARAVPEDEAARAARLPCAAARHSTRRTPPRTPTDLLDRLGLGERRNEPIEKLSLGNQQRAQIAAALVHDPEVLVLDEPFSGLDPIAVDTVMGVLAERAAAGVPVLFSSHQLDIVERLCDDLVIIADGTIRAAGSREDAARTARDASIRTARRRRHRLAARAARRDGRGVRRRLRRSSTPIGGRRAGGAACTPRLAATSSSFARQHPSLAQIFKEVIQ